MGRGRSSVDHEGALERFRAGRERERKSLLAAIERNSVLVQQVRRGVKRINRIRKQQRKGASAERVTPSTTCNAHYRQAWQVTERILERLQTEVLAAGASLLIFTVPFVDQAGVRTARDAKSCKPCVCPTSNPPTSKLVPIAERLGIQLVDLYPLISNPGAGDPLRFYYREDSHWNRAGHAIAARAVAEALLAE